MQTLHKVVDKETKKFHSTLCYPCKSLWDFSKKSEYDNILRRWKMTFQVSDKKGYHFLELLDDDNKLLELTYSKGGTWLKYFGHSNSLCARASRAILNHAPIGKYWLIFFSQKEFKCPCGEYPIETRCHILHDCKRYNNYWNPRISHFTLFLEFNSSAFSFGESIT